jgi:large subunit ribosomal protein L30
MAASLRVTLHKSPYGYTAKARGTVRSLGLHRIGQTVEIADDAAMRGQVRAVRFLVHVEEVPSEAPAAGATKKAPRDEEKSA